MAVQAEFGLFFQLPQADGQDVPSRYRDTIAQVVHGDRIGWNAAWLAEMHFVREFSVLPSPIVTMAAGRGPDGADHARHRRHAGPAARSDPRR